MVTLTPFNTEIADKALEGRRLRERVDDLRPNDTRAVEVIGLIHKVVVADCGRMESARFLGLNALHVLAEFMLYHFAIEGPSPLTVKYWDAMGTTPRQEPKAPKLKRFPPILEFIGVWEKSWSERRARASTKRTHVRQRGLLPPDPQSS